MGTRSVRRAMWMTGEAEVGRTSDQLGKRRCGRGRGDEDGRFAADMTRFVTPPMTPAVKYTSSFTSRSVRGERQERMRRAVSRCDPPWALPLTRATSPPLPRCADLSSQVPSQQALP